MHPSTPSPDSRGDSRNDLTGRHGDVDRNGDLVDELDERLRGAIVAASPELAEQQLRAVKTLVRPWTVQR